MAEQRISQSLNKAYRQLKIEKTEFDRFKSHLGNLYSQIQCGGTEEKLKGDLMDFLKGAFYAPDYKVAPLESMDCVIHLGNNSDTQVGVIFEVKRPDSPEMISRTGLNNKALQELLLYYLRERVGKNNFRLKQLAVTNINEFFIFDAHEFERLFYSNKKLLKEFKQFTEGSLTSEKTDFFYKEIAAKAIDAVKDSINYTYFDIRAYKKHLDNGSDKKLLELYKIFSPVHLLKLQFQNDSNTLNKKFYAELLYIMGLVEVEENDTKKRIITRLDAESRCPASIIENTINIIDAEDCLSDIRNRSAYGKNRDEQLFNLALELSINWINRVLFLKLLEAQMVKYHKGDTSYAFMGPENIADYDELNSLFFQVLARRPKERSAEINEKYGKVPYLNSSLFEVSSLERHTIKVSNLQGKDLPLYYGTVLKDGLKPRYKKLPTLRYLLEFLDSYDFASEGSEDIQEQPKTLINASVLGLIFEKLNGHKDGSVFTPGAVTMYMSREAFRKTIVHKFNEHYGWSCKTYDELRDKEFTDIADANEVINSLRICDSAVGSGHFLVSALNELIAVKYDLGILVDCEGKRVKKTDYSIEIDSDELIVSDADGEPFNYLPGNKESQRIQELLFQEKRRIIENCLFGVDINPNAVNICRLRLWIELLKNAYYTKESEFTELETLPNIDINIKAGNSLLYRFGLNQDISQILKKSGITISQYRQMVFDYKNARTKEAKRDIEQAIEKIKSGLKTEINFHDPKYTRLTRLQKEVSDLEAPQLFGQDFKVTAKKRKEIEEKKKEIAKIEAYFDEIKNNKMYLGAFEWRLEFPEVLDDAGNFVGFDCVIGNPPYIQLQSMGDDSVTLGRMNYACYEKKGDIYCLFYELGLSLLKPGCLLSFITSNKWMRTEYGESTRKFLAEHSNPEVLIDFTGIKIFEAATVEVNILTVTKKVNEGRTLACAINKDAFELNKLSDYVQQNSGETAFLDGDSWVILSEIERSIKHKVEAIGTPLSQWDVNIYRGILTGYNDAFIISTQKRDEIMAACSSDEERERTAEIIRPILRGRDICRYACNWADLWIINTHNGVKGVYDRVHIEDYPAIKAHLDGYWTKIESRADQGDTPYNLRNCAYMDDLSKPKIIWGEISDRSKFYYDETGFYYPEATTFLMTGERLELLLPFLNCKLSEYLFSKIGTTTGVGTVRWKKFKIEKLPVPASLPESVVERIAILSKEIAIERANGHDTKALEDIIDRCIYEAFGLSDEEVQFIESR